MKSHLKRLAAPKTWQVNRKTHTYITKQNAGPHSIEMSMPLGVILKEVLNFAKTTREAKKILNKSVVKIDNIQRKDFRFPVGLFDTIEFPAINEHYKVILNNKGKIELAKAKKEELSSKPCKIVGKTMVKGKVQLNLYDGKNVTVDKDEYTVGDSVIFSLNDKKISKHLKLHKKATVFLTGGKHIGQTGHVEDIVKDKIIYKDAKGELAETSKQYAFVIG